MYFETCTFIHFISQLYYIKWKCLSGYLSKRFVTVSISVSIKEYNYESAWNVNCVLRIFFGIRKKTHLKILCESCTKELCLWFSVMDSTSGGSIINHSRFLHPRRNWQHDYLKGLSSEYMAFFHYSINKMIKVCGTGEKRLPVLEKMLYVCSQGNRYNAQISSRG